MQVHTQTDGCKGGKTSVRAELRRAVEAERSIQQVDFLECIVHSTKETDRSYRLFGITRFSFLSSRIDGIAQRTQTEAPIFIAHWVGDRFLKIYTSGKIEEVFVQSLIEMQFGFRIPFQLIVFGYFERSFLRT